MSGYPSVVQQLLAALWSILVRDEDEPPPPARVSGLDRIVEAAITQVDPRVDGVEPDPELEGPTKPTA